MYNWSFKTINKIDKLLVKLKSMQRGKMCLQYEKTDLMVIKNK